MRAGRRRDRVGAIATALRAALTAFALLAAAACARAPAQPPAPVTEAERLAAADAVLALASDPGSRLSLFEGGLTADAFHWTTEERVVWDDLPHGGMTPDLPRGPRMVKERRLRGPDRLSFRFADLLAAEPYEMLLETDVAITLRGEPEPFVLDVGGDDAARRLAAALDVLIRARTQAP